MTDRTLPRCLLIVTAEVDAEVIERALVVRWNCGG